MPFDAVQICCESVTVKGFDPVEGTYKLATLGSFILFFKFMKISRNTLQTDPLPHHSRAQYKRAADGDIPVQRDRQVVV